MSEHLQLYMRSVHLGQVIMNVTCAASFTSYMAGSVGMLYHLLDCDVIPMSGLQCLCLVFKFIPMSRLKCYVYVWFANLYLVLLYNIIPTSVMVTSVFGKFDFRPVIPTSGLHFYTYVCYIQFWFS